MPHTALARALASIALLLSSLAACDGTESADPDVGACGDGRVDEGEACDDGDDNGAPGRCKPDCTSLRLVAIEGDVLAFMNEVKGQRIDGARVSILEQPDVQVVTGADAHFRFEGLLEGSDVTLVVEHPDYKTTQTATVTLGPNGVAPFAIQAVPNALFSALSGLMPEPVEEETHCILASTVARLGGSLYVYLRQGLADVEVWTEPSVPEGSGPIYFGEDVLPDPERELTSKDGGVLFYRVPPGEYVMRASRSDAVFNEVRFRCRPGVIVNAGPPLGLLANVEQPDHGAGVGRAPDAFSASTEALCEATAACVNEDAGEVRYPDVTVASCKAMFANTWAFVDESCDAELALREAARALYVCRTSSCDVTLGGDDVCTAEEAALTDAQSVYGTCLVQSRPD